MRPVLPTIAALALGAGVAAARPPRGGFPDASRSRNTMTFSPAGLFHSDVVGEVQVPVRSRWYGVGGVTARNELSDDGDVSAVTLDVGGRYYAVGGGPEGLWAGPMLGVGVIEGVNNGGTTRRAGALRGGLLAGGTWVPFGRLVLMAAVGIAYEHVSVRIGGHTVGGNGVTPEARAAIGFSF